MLFALNRNNIANFICYSYLKEIHLQLFHKQNETIATVNGSRTLQAMLCGTSRRSAARVLSQTPWILNKLRSACVAVVLSLSLFIPLSLSRSVLVVGLLVCGHKTKFGVHNGNCVFFSTLITSYMHSQCHNVSGPGSHPSSQCTSLPLPFQPATECECECRRKKCQPKFAGRRRLRIKMRIKRKCI